MLYFPTTSPDGERVECNCCGSPAAVAMFKDLDTERGKEDMWLCEICGDTMLATAVTFPSGCTDPRLYQAVAKIGNMILAEVKKNREAINSSGPSH